MQKYTRMLVTVCSKGIQALLLFILILAPARAADPMVFPDTMLEEALVYPDWFEISSGDLREDLKRALDAGKQGIIVYFGQKRCAYCQQFMQQDLGSEDIANYLRKHFNIIPIDIWGIEDLIDTDGKSYSERELSIHYETNFTPSLIFYNNKGKAVFGLRGFYPPYKFRAALEYVTEKFYQKENFREYLARAEPGLFFTEGGLNERDFFTGPPYDLKRTLKSDKPLVVFFEQGNCHACDLLHSGPLNKPETLEEINNMHAVQLDMWSDTTVTAPDGKRTTAKAWAKELGIFHTPTLLFFNPSGEEIMRIESIVQFYRLWGVLDFINKRAYETESDYQAWRLKQREIQ